MADWDKISHISFPARAKDQCAEWFTRVLGFRVFDEVETADRRGVLLRHAGPGTVSEFRKHDRNQGKQFVPRRTGLDQIGLKTGSPDVLTRWQEHLEALNLDYAPVADHDYGPGLTFRHPDGRQSEMFHRADHP